jgi:radical SAM superfamily enzyme YgiQ (UPF0313 family)
MAVRSLLIKSGKRGASEDFVGVNLEPLGLMQIAAFVRRYSAHAVALLDAQAEDARVERTADGAVRMAMPDAVLADRLRAEAPHVVGISALFEAQHAEVLRVARLVKTVAPATVVVVGGLDAGVRYEDYLRAGGIDLVVRGDGEETFVAILDHCDRGAPLTGIDGTCERTADGGCRMNPPRVARVPFDAYPFPDRDALPRALYDGARTQGGAFPYAREHPAFLIQGSRGCQLRCAFCDIVAVQDTWNAHGPEYVVDEIQHCVERYGAREIIFVDDNFMLDKRWAARIFELIVARGLDVSLDVMPGVSVWTLSEPMIDLMVRAGVYRVCLPIESGNPATLAFIKKPIDLAKARAMIEYCNRRGLYTFANLIIGFPEETEADIQRTIDWGTASGLDAVHYFIATPLPGARMYPIYVANEWIVPGESPHMSWRTRHFTREQLEVRAQEAARAYLRRRLRFYADPRHLVGYLLPKLASRRKLGYALRLAGYVIFGRSWRGGRRVRLPAATSRDDRVGALAPALPRS